MTRHLGVIAMMCALTACQHEYVNTLRRPSGVVAEYTGHFFLFGLMGQPHIHAYEACPRGVYRIVSAQTGLDTLIHLATLFIYTPRSYTIECAA